MNIVLIGLQNSGKSTLGETLACALGWEFLDTDQLIVEDHEAENSALTIKDIYKRLGEKAFRTLEHHTLRALPLRGNTVIATGGGTIENPKNIPLLQQLGTIIYLKTPFSTFQKRLREPAYLIAEPEAQLTLYRHRTGVMQSLAELTLEMDSLSPTACTNAVFHFIKESHRGK